MKRNVTKSEFRKFSVQLRKTDVSLKTCCDEPWVVLADPQDSTTYKNDHTLIFERCQVLTVTTKYNGGAEVPALGVVVNFPNDDFARGFVIDWRLYYDMASQLIQGTYEVFVETTLAGITEKFSFNTFFLLKYTRAQAEGTVRIASIFNKYSELYDIDFSGSGARDAVRLRGFFGYRQPNYETKNNTEISKKRENVFRKSNNSYSLIIEPTLECKTQRVEQIHLLHASECYISDFNNFNHYKEILDLPVILSDDNTPEFEYFEGIGTKYAKVLAEFKDKVSIRKSKNTGTGQDVNIPNIGLWQGVTCNAITPICLDANYSLTLDDIVVDSGSIPSGGSESIPIDAFIPPCPPFNDVIVNINGLLFQTRASGQTSSVVVKQGGVNVGSLVGSEWIVPVPATLGRMPIKTFQTTSFATGDDGSTQRGAGVSLLVLPYNNPHGNTTRFTALDGTQTYTNSVAVDWLTWNTTTNTVLLTYFGSDVIGVSRNFQAGIDHIATLTIATLTDWRMINKNELIFICEDETSYNSIDYAPFNIGALVIGTSTNSATNRLSRTTGGGLTSSGKTTGMRTLAVRVGTVTGIVIT